MKILIYGLQGVLASFALCAFFFVTFMAASMAMHFSEYVRCGTGLPTANYECRE